MLTTHPANPITGIPSFTDVEVVEGARAGRTIQVNPFLLAEVHYDTYDVRSQIKLTGDTSIACPLMEMEDDFFWTADMFLRVDRTRLRPLPSSGLAYRSPVMEFDRRALAAKVQQGYVRHFPIRILHHPLLKCFSHPHESREDFLQRCRARIHEEAAPEWLSLRKKHQRGLEGIKERYHLRPEVYAEDASFAHLEERRRRRIQEADERLTRLFFALGAPLPPPSGQPPMEDQEDLEYALNEMLAAAHRELTVFYAELEARLLSVEEYEIRHRHADITLHQLSVLWLPTGAETEAGESGPPAP
ncbi:MAG: hypothetical protein KA419_07955 [Acidobacteria bacterium]|nr:hypothetical protein [Acidobacteriota bacterium]